MTSTATIVLSVYLLVVVAADMTVYFRNRKGRQESRRGFRTARLILEGITILAAVAGMAFPSAHTAMFIVLAVSATAAFVLQMLEGKR